MGWVTKEQIGLAREINILDYVLSYESGNVRRVGGGYRLKDHPSLAINNYGWFWHSQDVGGKTALDYLVAVRGYAFVDAVCKLNGEKASERSVMKEAAPPERKPFSLPPRSANNTRAVAYLQSRGIAKPLIMDCIERGLIYQSANYNNCVFVGRDEHGKARNAALRGTLADYKQDVTGSDKRYGFLLPPDNPGSNAVAVFESAVDALSHQTLCLQGFIPEFDGWRLSLGGTSLLALTHFLELHLQITHCVVCTDDDEAGNRAAAKIRGITGLAVERSPPLCGKDWNEALLALQKSERMQNRTRQNSTPCM